MKTPKPLFVLTGVGAAAESSKENRPSIGILTLNTDTEELKFAMNIDGAEAIIRSSTL
ncbi:hypothetical protein [Mesorhizobium sp. M0220]|uniref:hypothetical protein n=1 Tax=Mesorhizobium sp. M0220 TaxID=2956920 RepID=UPI0033361E7F